MGNGSVTRERILQIALQVFAEHGYEGARMDKIAAEVGINKASLYFHFKSKEDIFRGLFQQILGKYRSWLKELLDEVKTLPCKERLTAIYEKYFDYNWNNREMEFWNRIYYLPPAAMRKEILVETMETKDSFIAQLSVIMEEGIRRKELRPHGAVSMAKSYYYILTCIDLSMDLLDKEQSLKDMEECFSIFWEGIKA